MAENTDRLPGRESDGLVEFLSTVETPVVSDAIERLGVRNQATGFAGRRLRCLTPGLGVFCGRAVTVQASSAGAERVSKSDSVDRFIEVCRAVAATPPPVALVIGDFGVRPDFSAHIGEVLVNVFRRFGARAVVSDGAVRDLGEIERLGFHVFAPGRLASRGNHAFLRVQVPVVVCGLTVEPGDLLHGDENGLISVPVDGRERLPGIIDEIRRREKSVLDYLGRPEVDLEKLRARLLGKETPEDD